MVLVRTASFLFASLAVIACDSSKPTSVDATPAASIARGSAAFLTACASCHASRDGFDLAFFGFPDSVIVRRALKHVSRATGEDIAAYIRSLPVSPGGEQYRLFQPANVAATSDGTHAIYVGSMWATGLWREKMSITLAKLPPPSLAG